MVSTNIEQSKKLVEFGLDINTADMVYLYWINSKTKQEGIDDIPTIREELPIQKADIPAWSLSALLKNLPNTVGKYSLSLYPNIESKWCCSYRDMYHYNEKFGHSDLVHFVDDEPINAVFKMVEYVFVNKFNVK